LKCWVDAYISWIQKIVYEPFSLLLADGFIVLKAELNSKQPMIYTYLKRLTTAKKLNRL
jgi:hypothetical protein